MAVYPEVGSVYQPLNVDKQEFRLLTVHAGLGQEKVQAKVTVASFYEPPAYETISYCWGDATQLSTLELNGINTTVPASAEAAIRKVRAQSGCRVLWVDAICINQKDLTERAHQVQMMSLIYSKSTGNLIYLGEGDVSTRSALNSIQNVYLDLEQETESFSRLEGTLLATGRGPIKPSTELTCAVDIPAMKTFFALPWFRRLWVFQEIVLAPFNTCYIGPFDFSFLLLVRAATWLFGSKRIDHELVQLLYKSNCTLSFHFVDKTLGACGKGVTPKMENLLSAALYYLATDPRDFVYGMLGIHQSVEANPLNHLLKPDYTKSAADVFRDATKYLVQVREYVRVWLWIHWESDEKFNEWSMPSWALDWSQLRVAKSLDLHLRAFNAGGEGVRARSVVFSESDVNVVLVEGVRIAEVVDITPVLTDEVMLEDGAEKRSAWLADCISKVRPYLPPDETKTALALILTVFDNGRYLHTEKRIRAMVGFCSSIGVDMTHLTQLSVEFDNDKQSELASSFSQALSYTCTNRRIFVTSAGHLGIGPPVVAKGDIVAVFSGFHVPYVLRSSGQEYRIVGATYVSGIMHGEAMEQHGGHEESNTVFRIR